ANPLPALFFFNDTATTEIYTLSLHDALPICNQKAVCQFPKIIFFNSYILFRSEEHTSELQSLTNLVCRLLLEKKKQTTRNTRPTKSQHKRQKAHDRDVKR